MFDKFADYAYYLLPSPFKRVAKAINQFYIWCTVMGKHIDDLQQDIYTVREQTMIISANETFLALHGIDRSVRRLRGETVDNYRIRLMLYTKIAEQAGTNQAIYYVARAFGYDNVTITRSSESALWATATVSLIGGNIVLDDRDLMIAELNRVKPASAILELTKEQRYQGKQYFGSAYIIGKIITIRQG